MVMARSDSADDSGRRVFRQNLIAHLSPGLFFRGVECFFVFFFKESILGLPATARTATLTNGDG